MSDFKGWLFVVRVPYFKFNFKFQISILNCYRVYYVIKLFYIFFKFNNVYKTKKQQVSGTVNNDMKVKRNLN